MLLALLAEVGVLVFIGLVCGVTVWSVGRTPKVAPEEELPVVDIVPLPSGHLIEVSWPRGRRRALARLLIREYADIRDVRPLEDWPPEYVENLVDSETLLCLDATLEGAMKWLELPEEAKC
jgi:hypothetical protein